MIHSFLVKNEKYLFDGKTLQLYKGEITNDIEEIHYKSANELYIVTFLVTNACNSKCVYCYEQKGNMCMDQHAADRAIEVLKKRTKKITRVRFFGGEPLINFSIIKYIVQRLKNNFEIEIFEITTNGTLISDEIINFFVENQFKVLISMDGPKDIHNKLRIGCSHDRVLGNIIKLFESPIGDLLEVNCTYTKYHDEKIGRNALEEYFDKLGVKYAITDVITQIDWLRLSSQDILDKRKKNIDRSFECLYNKSLNVGISPYVSSVINAVVKHEYNSRFCTEINEGISFDVDGKCYPCTRLIKKCEINDPKLLMYNVKNNNICNECWAKGLCFYCVANIYS